ncbi:MAG: ABC transporter substrate-binding protein [Acidimicrobiia bacterium]
MRTPKARVTSLLVLVLLTAACGGTQSGTTTASTEPPATVATTTPAVATTEPAPATTGTATADPMAMECSPVDYQGASATLNFVWWVGGGDTASDNLFTDALDCFNQRYAGTIEAVVDYVPGGHDYEAKLRTDYAASGQLPIVVAPKRVGDLAQIWIDNDELVDLKPYFDASPEWQQIAIAESTTFNTVDGKLLAAPDTFVTPVGLFYNMELLGQAGVDKVPETWDEWWATLEALKAAGIPAVSLHTQDIGWSAMLIFEALVARTPEGEAFLGEKYPTDYNHPFIIEASRDIARVFEFTTPDAVGSAYELAANNFLSGKTAIMPNGPWMIGEFRDPELSSEGFGDKIASGLYPGPVAVDDAGIQVGDWAIGAGYSQEETDAAAEFIEFMAGPEFTRQRVIRMGSIAPNLPLPAEDLASLDPLAADLLTLIQDNNAPILPGYFVQWTSIIQNETIVQGLPQLALGQITPEEFAQQLTDAAQETP